MVLYIQFYKTCTSILTIQLHLLKENFLTPKIIKSQNTQGKIKKTHILSLNEKQTFFRLKEALEPRYIVLAQVSFNALIWAGSRDIRNRFNRKMADFVIYDGNLNIIAVVELDDASHQGQEQRDADRDCLLHEAGIKVIRYPRLPDIQQVQRDFNL